MVDRRRLSRARSAAFMSAVSLSFNVAIEQLPGDRHLEVTAEWECAPLSAHSWRVVIPVSSLQHGQQARVKVVSVDAEARALANRHAPDVSPRVRPARLHSTHDIPRTHAKRALGARAVTSWEPVAVR